MAGVVSAAALHAVGPYAELALAYVERGYSPVPIDGKHPPLDGYTGWRGKFVNRTEALRLIGSHGSSNVGLRLHDDVVGIEPVNQSGRLRGDDDLRMVGGGSEQTAYEVQRRRMQSQFWFVNDHHFGQLRLRLKQQGRQCDESQRAVRELVRAEDVA